MKGLIKVSTPPTTDCWKDQPVNMEELVAVNAVAGVMEFMEGYQARMADLDEWLQDLE